MRRRIIVSLLLVSVLLAGGGAFLRHLILTRPLPPKAETARPILAVRAIKVEPRTTVEPIFGYGIARADRYARLAAQVSGEVVDLAENLRIGRRAQAGEVLVSIDDRAYRAALERARSQLAAEQAALQQLVIEERNLAMLVQIAQEELGVAERELNRIRDLLERGDSTPRELDQARGTYERARRAAQTLVNEQGLFPQRRARQEALCALRRAEVARAELDLEHCTIRAPFDGELDEVNVELGEQVAPGNPLLALVARDLIEVAVELPASKRQRVRVGAAVHLSLESRPGVFWAGRIARIGPSADEATRTFSVFAEVRNDDQHDPLMPGMFVQARVEGPTLRDVLIVPRGSIENGRVFVCRDGRVYQRRVRVDRHLLDQAVVEGLAPGDIVVTSNLDALYDGAPVEVLLEDTWAGSPAWPAPTTDPQGVP